MRRFSKLLGVATLSSALIGCSASGPSDDIGNDPPLADLDEIYAGAPKSDSIPLGAYKFDGPLPAKSTELIETQSPVQSQGKRGVCSIFSTVGLMEHLYIAEGGITNPDFSEQYLQWSAKFEVFSFPNSSGSNAGVNLQAISRFGIPAEDAWPYEISQWGVSDDEECDGEDEQPTRCYTNGTPPQEALDAEKFHLPASRWLHPTDIRNHIHSEKTGVVVGLTFF